MSLSCICNWQRFSELLNITFCFSQCTRVPFASKKKKKKRHFEVNTPLNQHRFWHELVGNSKQSSQRAVKITEAPKQAGIMAKVEWTHGEQPGGEEHPREARTDGASPHTNPRKEEKGDSLLSPFLQQQTIHRKSSKALGGSRS